MGLPNWINLIMDVDHEEVCRRLWQRAVVLLDSEVVSSCAAHSQAHSCLKYLSRLVETRNQRAYENLFLRVTQLEESPEDIRLRNQQEVGILLSNHGQKKVIPSSEIFSDVHDLKMVAHLHEGLEWLSSRIGGGLSRLK